MKGDLESIIFEKQQEQQMVQTTFDSKNKHVKIYQDSSKFEITQGKFIVSKERERQYDEIIDHEWRQARGKIYKQQIKEKLNQQKVKESLQAQIIELFLTKNNIDLYNLGGLNQYKAMILRIKQMIQAKEKHYKLKQRQCLPIKQIIKLKLNSLTLISISYHQIISAKNINYCRYSISAFELFNVVHQNRQLSEVVLRGVQVEQFQDFLASFAKNNIKAQQNEALSWLAHFRPPESLKLTINATLEFDVSNNSQTLKLINILGMFKQLSQIKVNLILGTWIGKSWWEVTLQKLWVFLLKIKKIRMRIEGHPRAQISGSVARSALFGGLAFFTEITQLTFLQIQPMYNFGLHDLLGIQEILATIFTNNIVTHLGIYECDNFPNLPTITTLHSINVEKTSFRNDLAMSGVIKNNRQLQSLTIYKNNRQQKAIDEQLFDKLSNLIIQSYSNAFFKDIRPKIPSNIRYLSIFRQRISIVECLPILFSKLLHLTSLDIGRIHFDHQVLCSIPSPYLQELRVYWNSGITNKCLEAIDSKWPKLRRLTLKQCRNVTQIVWKICKFRGLMELDVDTKIVEARKTLILLKGRGVKVL